MPDRTLKLQDILHILDRMAPFSSAESWDNVGLMVGSPAKEVTSILVALDPTCAILDEALSRNCDAIITHHPLVFKPLKAIRTDTPIGEFISLALRHSVSVISCHTNLDVASQGVNDVFAESIGLRDILPLFPANVRGETPAFGRVGRYPHPIDQTDFTKILMEALHISAVKVAGQIPRQVSTVAVCGGSGSDLAETARAVGADVYVSGEIKLSVARWAEETEFCIIDAGHFATENIVLDTFARQIRTTLKAEGFEAEVMRTNTQTDPFQFIFMEQPNTIFRNDKR